MAKDDPLFAVSVFYFYSRTNGISVIRNYSAFSPVSCYSAIVYSLLVYFYYSNEDFNSLTNDYNIFFIFVLFFYKWPRLNFAELSIVVEILFFAIDLFSYFKGICCFTLLILIFFADYFFDYISYSLCYIDGYIDDSYVLLTLPSYWRSDTTSTPFIR